MKVKTTFYNHNVGSDFDPVLHVIYPDNRADQLSYVPTSKMIDTMFRTGQMVQASKQYYDFPDGKDDGRDVPLDRLRGLEMPEISQAMNENEHKLESHKKNLSDMITADQKARKKSGSKPAADEKSDGSVADGAIDGSKQAKS